MVEIEGVLVGATGIDVGDGAVSGPVEPHAPMMTWITTTATSRFAPSTL